LKWLVRGTFAITALNAFLFVAEMAQPGNILNREYNAKENK